MESQIVQSELQLMTGAVALGAVCAIVATLILFPVIDRAVRPRFRLERGSAMIVLLAASLLVGIAGGTAGYFWLREREAERWDDPGGTQVERAGGGGLLINEGSAIGRLAIRADGLPPAVCP